MAAEMLDVDEKTIRNWEGGKSPIPYAAFRVMRLAGGYSLMDAGWEGWAIWQGKLYSPSGRGFEPYELDYLANYMQMARYFIQGLRASPSPAVSEQPHAGACVRSEPAEHQQATIQRDEAGSATALAGARLRHDANVIYVSFGKQKGGNSGLEVSDLKERL